MIGYKPFRTVLKGGSRLKDALEKTNTLAVVATNKELEQDPPEWYRKAIKNERFKEDMFKLVTNIEKTQKNDKIIFSKKFQFYINFHQVI